PCVGISSNSIAWPTRPAVGIRSMPTTMGRPRIGFDPFGWVRIDATAVHSRLALSPQEPRMRIFLAVIASLACVGPVFGDGKLFQDKVAGILEKRCVSCHNDEAPKGGLSLQSLDKALAGGDSGAAVAPGKPDESLILYYIE